MAFVSFIESLKKVALDSGFKKIWEVIGFFIQYASFTSFYAFESSSDPREPKGSVVLKVPSLSMEQPLDISFMRWTLQGMYHEAKHIQMMGSYWWGGLPQSWVDIDPKFKKYVPMAKLVDSELKLPCGWRAQYIIRNIEQHLFALHAFLLGMIVATTHSSEQYTLEVVDKIDGELKIVHSAMAVMQLTEDRLTNTGKSLFASLTRDYNDILLPLLRSFRWEIKHAE